VRRGDHGAEIEPVAAHEERHPGRRQDAPEQRVPTCRGDPGGQRRLEHLARFARVADDQHLWRLGTRDGRSRTAEAERELGRQELARNAADPVGPEQAPRRRGLFH
jgi:hypothetical protein